MQNKEYTGENSKITLENTINIFNSLDEMILVTNPDTDNILYINKPMKQLFNIESDCTGKKCYKILRNLEERCKFCPCNILSKEPNKDYTWEDALTFTDRVFQHTSKYIKWENGEKVHLQHSIDITNIKNTLIETEKLLVKLRLAVHGGKIGLWEMDVNHDDTVNPGNTIIYTDKFREMIGYSDENDFPNILCSWSDLLHPEDKDRVISIFEKHITDKTSKTPFNIEYRLLKKNNEYAYYHASGETTRDEEGNPIRVAGSLVDITESKNTLLETQRLRGEAEAANRAKSAFLANMSHEIRTPMNAILGIAEIKFRDETLSPEMEEGLEKIYESGNLLLGIINDILDLSKIEDGKMEILPINYDIPSIVNDIVQLNRLNYESKPIELYLNIDANTPLNLYGDELRIKQILSNVLSNAFKYTEKGKVELSVYVEYVDNTEDENDVILVFKVSDTGQGMTEEQVSKLFNEYTRFNTEANRTTIGTGLGMSITKHLLDLMGGQINVESEVDKGSVFTIRLPQKRVNSIVCGSELAEKLRTFSFKKTSMMKKTQFIREYMPYGSVLVVDDVESNIYVTRGMLLPYGLKIETVTSGRGAIEKIESGKLYDIIFMDHRMPKMDGIEAVKIIRSMGYKNFIVALTANAIVGQAGVFIENGFDGYISKPIDSRELNSLLNDFIRNKKPTEVVEAARLEQNKKMLKKKNIISEKGSQSDIEKFFKIDAENAVNVLSDIYKKLQSVESCTKRSQTGVLDDTDMETYVVTVHGMKSALTNIGEAKLSAAAIRLEQAGIERDLELMVGETSVFLDALRALIHKLKTKNERETDDEEITEEDKLFLQKKMLLIREACISFNSNAARKALDDLMLKSWPRRICDMLDEISINLLHSAFKKAADITGKC